MNLLNMTRWFNAIPPGAIKDNAAWTAYVIDKQTDLPHGCKGVLFAIALGATDIALAALKVQESDTKSTSTALGGTPADVHDMATKPAADDDNEIHLLYVPIEKITERYFQLQGTAGDGSAGTYLSAIAIFDMPGVTGVDVTNLNVGNVEIA